MKKVKKRVKKWKKNKKTGIREDYSAEMSGSNSSCYSLHRVQEYAINENGDPLERNEGFSLQPLDAQIYGKKLAAESKTKFARKKNEENKRIMEEMREK